LIASIYALIYPLLNIRQWFMQTIETDVPHVWAYLPEIWVQSNATPTSVYSLHNVLLGLALLGTIILLGLFLVRLLSLLRIHLHSVIAQWHTYLYRNVQYPIVPFSFFNKIYLHKPQHEDSELYDIFEHENIHVKGLHSMDIIWFEMLWIVCWFNPFVWLMRKAVRQNLEFLTDQQVLNKGVDRKTYQYSLLHVTQRGTAVHMGNKFNFKTLKKRIMMMNKNRSSKLELSKYAFLLPVIILIGASFTVQKTEKQVEDVVSKVKETDVTTLIGSSPHQLFSPNDNGTNALSPISKDTTKDTKEIKKLKNRSEIDRDKDYYYEYDKKAISKAAFFALRDEEVYDILLIEDHQAFESLHPAAKGKDGVVRAYSLEMHEQHKKEAELMLYVVDGKIVTQNQFKELDPNTIEAVNVMKDKSAVTKFGEKGKYGAIEITMKAQTKTDSNRTAKSDVLTTVGKLKGKATGIQLESLALQTGKRILFIVDGEKMPLDFDTKSLNSNNIESISILKEKSAIALYGNNAKDGVMIIKSKTLTAPLATETPELTNQGQDLQKARIDEVVVIGYSAQQKSAARNSNSIRNQNL